jgi:hypothetical protein
MTKKKTVGKRPRADERKRKSVRNSRMDDNPVEAQADRLWTKVRNFFRLTLGITSGDIHSFQLYKTDSGYHTVYLKDLPPTNSASIPSNPN